MLTMSTIADPIPTQFINDAEGNPIAVILPIALYERMKTLLEQPRESKRQPLNFVWDDEGEIRPELKAQLLRQSAAIRAGERGISLEDAVKLLDIEA